MNLFAPFRPLLPLLLAASLFGAACDGGNGDGPPATNELATTFAAAQPGVVLGLTLTVPVDKQQQPLLDCPQGGTLDVNNRTGADPTFSRVLLYKKCNGLDGQLTLSGATAFKEQFVYYDAFLSGTLEGLCRVNLRNFVESVQVNASDAKPVRTTLAGNVTAQCSSGQVLCTFNNAVYDSKTAAETFAASCEAGR